MPHNAHARLRREHREAIESLSPAQVRAVRRLLAARQTQPESDGAAEVALLKIIANESDGVPCRTEDEIPDWWVAR